MKITKRFTFEAGHRLSNHDGKCRRPHGHSYKLEITLDGDIDLRPIASGGMVVDFGRLSDLVKQLVVEPLDHRFLLSTDQMNPWREAVDDKSVVGGTGDWVAHLPIQATTAELMVMWIRGILGAALAQNVDGNWTGIHLDKITLYETETGRATWERSSTSARPSASSALTSLG